MAGRSDFTSAEWATMQRAVMSAPVLVALSDGGRLDFMMELHAVNQKLETARAGHYSQLVEELADVTMERAGLRSNMTAAELQGPALEALRASAATVAAKAPDEADSFCDFVVGLAEIAAGAARTGGFLGLGGEVVSAAEAAAVARIKEALRGEQPGGRPAAG